MATMTLNSTASSWQVYSPRIIALAIGLFAGPLITNMAGWQITGRQIQYQVHAGIVEHQALFCAAKAHMEMPGTIMLSYADRDRLAKKWAVMPGATATEHDVVRACARKLASR